MPRRCAFQAPVPLLLTAVLLVGLVAPAAAAPTAVERSQAVDSALAAVSAADSEAAKQIKGLAQNDPERARALAATWAQLPSTMDSNTKHAALAATNEQLTEQKTKDQQNEAQKKFLGFNWGMGVATSFNLGRGDRVTSAKNVNGIVRVEQSSNQQPRILLEVHHFLNQPVDDVKVKWGHGPWVGVQSSKDQAIDSFALGYMVGWRPADESGAAFCLGIGAVIDPNVQVLGDGLHANQPLPAGESDVRLKKESRVGAAVMVSFTF